MPLLLRAARVYSSIAVAVAKRAGSFSAHASVRSGVSGVGALRLLVPFTQGGGRGAQHGRQAGRLLAPLIVAVGALPLMLRVAETKEGDDIIQAADKLYDQGKTSELHSLLAKHLQADQGNGAAHWRYARACHDLAALVTSSLAPFRQFLLWVDVFNSFSSFSFLFPAQ